MSAIPQKQIIDYTAGVGRFVKISLKMDKNSDKLAIEAIKRTIIFIIAVKPYFREDWVGFFWINSCASKNEINLLLNEFNDDYLCEITFLDNENC